MSPNRGTFKGFTGRYLPLEGDFEGGVALEDLDAMVVFLESCGSSDGRGVFAIEMGLEKVPKAASD
jgi:hypothetical protein